jgi:predicted metal-dependent hydrolase
MAAVSSEIRIRSIAFDVARGRGGLWNPRLPEVSHALNAFQLALPYLEPYFVDTIREAARDVDDPRLRADALAFCAQEASHSREHGRYNRLLRKRYPHVAIFERAVQRSLIRSRRHDSLACRLAFTAACEAITGELARFLFGHADAWFRDADGHFAALMLWHAVEEIEHKSVAFDVLRARGVPHRSRVRALGAAVRQMLFDLDPVATYMLAVDGIEGPASRMRRLSFRVAFSAAVGPRLLKYAAPGYDPSREPDPPFVASWMSAFARGVPLDAIDTARPIAAGLAAAPGPSTIPAGRKDLTKPRRR